MIGKSNAVSSSEDKGISFKKCTTTYTIFDSLSAAGYYRKLSFEDGNGITPLSNINCRTSFNFTGHTSFYKYQGRQLFFNKDSALSLLVELGLNQLENGKYLVGIVTPNFDSYIDSGFHHTIPLGSVQGTNIQVTDGNITVLDDWITVTGPDTSDKSFAQFHVYMCIKYP